METNIVQNTEDQNNVIITNIKWHVPNNASGVLSTKTELPVEFSISIPNFIDAKLQSQNQKDQLETFIYNFLTKKFGVECTSCQIWLPLD